MKRGGVSGCLLVALVSFSLVSAALQSNLSFIEITDRQRSILGSSDRASWLDQQELLFHCNQSYEKRGNLSSLQLQAVQAALRGADLAGAPAALWGSLATDWAGNCDIPNGEPLQIFVSHRAFVSVSHFSLFLVRILLFHHSAQVGRRHCGISD
jgi:hypothetical protein